MRDKQMESCVIDFADEDINNILELFHVLSDGTHGAAGRYELINCFKSRNVLNRVSIFSVLYPNN